jgi:ketosteroid isomerase-like protein
MSEENIEMVRSFYEAFNRGDWDAMFRDAHPDFELTTPPQLPNAGTYRGREECQRFLQDGLAAFEASIVEPEEFFESGDRVVAVYTNRVRPKGSSAEIENRNAQLWTIRDGKVKSVRFFPNPRDALEAAGLCE